MTASKRERNIGIGVYNAIKWIYALAANTAVDAGSIPLYGISESPDHPFHNFDI